MYLIDDIPGRGAYDAVIVGGGPAGLSTALVLGRARRRVLVVDSGRPANAVSQGVGGLLGQTRVRPAELRAAGREQLAAHPNVDVRHDEVVAAEAWGGTFELTLARGGTVFAGAVVLAHGLRYEPPPLPGIHGLWGSAVFHCAFCDGWEVRDRPLAIHGSGPAAARSAMVLAGWSNDVVLLTDGPARLNGERAALERAGVRIREERIARLVGAGGRLERIELEDGPPEERDALFVTTRRGQPNALAEMLGCALTDAGTIVTDIDGRTSVPGVFAAGDAATERSRSVANALGTGSRVAYAVALDLVAELAA
ncbi:MAG TPA: NAD(P)/FAD-dependent oxidoreductase [Solirubrobacteraceae bacterium]